jgi:Na+/melibiose symporter-like transporter
MFSPSIKSVASSICTTVCWILGFAVTKWFSSIEAVIGSYGAFWLFGVFCVIAFLFVLFIVMETKGLSMQEIQEKLAGR